MNLSEKELYLCVKVLNIEIGQTEELEELNSYVALNFGKDVKHTKLIKDDYRPDF